MLFFFVRELQITHGIFGRFAHERRDALRHIAQAFELARNHALKSAAFLANLNAAFFADFYAFASAAFFANLNAAPFALFKSFRSVVRSEFFHYFTHRRLLFILEFFSHGGICRFARYVLQKRQNFVAMTRRALGRERKIAGSETAQTLRNEFEFAAERFDFSVAQPRQFDYANGIIDNPRFRH